MAEPRKMAPDFNKQETHAGKPERRVHVPFRLSAAGLAKIDELAALETEGVRSHMIRKLLNEALARRLRMPRADR